nr:MAG TPA: hypothetical protein [Caudoviricetes sp.]
MNTSLIYIFTIFYNIIITCIFPNSVRTLSELHLLFPTNLSVIFNRALFSLS